MEQVNTAENFQDCLQHGELFKEFFQAYQDENGRHTYVEQVQKMSLEGLLSLYVNYDDLLRFDPELARLLREEPEEISGFY